MKSAKSVTHFLPYLFTYFILHQQRLKTTALRSSKKQNPPPLQGTSQHLGQGKKPCFKRDPSIKTWGVYLCLKIRDPKIYFFKTICRGFGGVFFILRIFIVCLAVHDETFLAWFAHITIWKGSETPNCDLVSRPPSFWSF